MDINGKSFKKIFNADIVRFSPTSMRINNNIFEIESSYRPLIRDRELKAQERELVIDFTSEEDISSMTAEICNESTIDIDDGYIYRVWLKQEPSINEEAHGFYTVTYPLLVLKQKSMITITDYKDFTILGNVITGVVLEITSPVEVKETKVGEYTIHDLKASKTLIINGMDMLVYYKDTPSLSAFDDVDLSQFPKFDKGEQSLSCDNDNVTIVIKYYPTYM